MKTLEDEMKIGIRYRLFLALLAATALVALGMYAIMQWSIDRGFLRYVNTLDEERLERLADSLEQSWATEGSWEFLREDPAKWRIIVLRSLPEGMIEPEHLKRLERRLERQEEKDFPPPPRFGQLFEKRLLLLDARGERVVGSGDIQRKKEFRPLTHQGRTVGYLGLAPRKELLDVHQLRFVKEQKLALALVAGLMLLVSALLALPLAKRLVRPVRGLAAATRRLAAGEYASRVPVASSDELGQLARDFNSLALTLERNEQARRQWVADISHELRTPLSVLRGEIEAIQDGLRQPTPEAVGSLHGEVMRLSRMVDDLHQLALSDVGALTYRKEEVDLAEVLFDAVDLYKPEFDRKRLALRPEIPAGERFPVFADQERLGQLFTNLLSNSLKYTDAPGELLVRLERRGAMAAIHFQDSSPGVPERELGRLFDRLYRVEGSRSRSTGGAGLGLSICRNIAEAHEGSIAARPSPLGGVWITVTLPLSEGGA